MEVSAALQSLLSCYSAVVEVITVYLAAVLAIMDAEEMTDAVLSSGSS
jgi:hypothetical protein